jgi:hypothetical protein
MFGNGNGNAYKRTQANGSLPPTLPPVVKTNGGGKKRKSPVVLTKKQEFMLGKRLEEVCVPPDTEYPYVRYVNGHSDRSLAEELGCTEYLVARYRTEVIGKLKAGGVERFGGNTPKKLGTRLIALEERIAMFETTLASIELAVTQLRHDLNERNS